MSEDGSHQAYRPRRTNSKLPELHLVTVCFSPFLCREVALTISDSATQYNTYGSPPNSHLLRKYGHVDVYPLPEEILASLPEEARTWGLGNEGDEVDLTGEEVLSGVLAMGSDGVESTGQREEELKERIDWWLDEGEDE